MMRGLAQQISMPCIWALAGMGLAIIPSLPGMGYAMRGGLNIGKAHMLKGAIMTV